jgi:hypothetical protein
MKLTELHPLQDRFRAFMGFDDFYEYTSAKTWTSTVGGGATVTVQSTGVGGILQLACVDATQNREVYVGHTVQPFIFNTDRSLEFETFVNFTEASTNQANIFAGFSSTFANGLLVNTNGGINTSFWGCGFFKQGGTNTNWQVVTSFGTVQTINTTTINAQSSNYTRLRVEVRILSSTLLESSFFIDNGSGLLIAKNNTVVNGFNYPIKHTGTWTSPTAMGAGVGVKNGTTAAETLLCDYIGWSQVRANAAGT